MENSEWRTPAMWGIGLTEDVSGGATYLHDARARTLGEAILWHGGEAVASKRRFVDMNENEKAPLLAFLRFL